MLERAARLSAQVQVAFCAGAFLASLSALGAGTPYCDERCADRFTRCSAPCPSDAHCAHRCEQELDACRTACASNRQLVDPKKCFDRDGQLAPCEKIQPDPKPIPEAKNKRTKKRPAHGGDGDRSPATR
jgi:hypothetical protein